VNGLIDCTTSPESGSLKVGMRGSFLVSVADTLSGGPSAQMVASPQAADERDEAPIEPAFVGHCRT